VLSALISIIYFQHVLNSLQTLGMLLVFLALAAHLRFKWYARDMRRARMRAKAAAEAAGALEAAAAVANTPDAMSPRVTSTGPKVARPPPSQLPASAAAAAEAAAQKGGGSSCGSEGSGSTAAARAAPAAAAPLAGMESWVTAEDALLGFACLPRRAAAWCRDATAANSLTLPIAAVVFVVVVASGKALLTKTVLDEVLYPPPLSPATPSPRAPPPPLPPSLPPTHPHTPPSSVPPLAPLSPSRPPAPVVAVPRLRSLGSRSPSRPSRAR